MPDRVMHMAAVTYYWAIVHIRSCRPFNITGKIKRSEERTQLYFVRVHVFVYARHGRELMG